MIVKCISYMNGLHWVFENERGSLSIICHDGSYGRDKGLFEIMPSWRKPVEYDSVKGYLTFEEVAIWIKELESL